jgi:hypothetical protein
LFDGTNMGIGGTPVSSAGYTALTLNNATNSGYVVLQKNASTVSDWYVSGGTLATLRGVGVPLSLEATGANYIKFETNGSEAMRLTSSSLYTASGINVGFGVSSPQTRLHVANTGYSGSSAPYGAVSLVVGGATADSNWGHLVVSQASTSNGAGGKILFAYGSTIDTDLSPFAAITGSKQGSNYGDLLFFTRPSGGSNTERMRLDSAGNLGLGVTPSAWGGATALQIGAQMSAAYISGNAVIYNNAYYDGSTTKYISSNTASYYNQVSGSHIWATAASGTAGTGISFTQAMTLDASGNLGIGTTSPGAKLDVVAGAFVDVNARISTGASTVGNYARLTFSEGAGATTLGWVNSWGSAMGAGLDSGMEVWNNRNSFLRFGTNNTERMRIDASGNLGLGVTPSAWSGFKAFEVGYLGSGINSTGVGQTNIFSNAYLNSGWKFAGTGSATLYQTLGANGHNWYVSSASGTIGNNVTFTQVLGVGLGQTVALEGATSQTGTGITFPATQSASSNANTLDDYEEGTWSATITTSGGSVTIGSQTCTYTKVGRFVVLNGFINLSAISSPTGQFTITNLPFVPGTDGTGGATCFLQSLNATAATSLYVELGTAPRIYVGKSTTLNSITDSADLLAATTLIKFGASYST